MATAIDDATIQSKLAEYFAASKYSTSGRTKSGFYWQMSFGGGPVLTTQKSLEFRVRYDGAVFYDPGSSEPVWNEHGYGIDGYNRIFPELPLDDEEVPATVRKYMREIWEHFSWCYDTPGRSARSNRRYIGETLHLTMDVQALENPRRQASDRLMATRPY